MGILNHDPFIYSNGTGILKTFTADDADNIVTLYEPTRVPNIDDLWYTAHLQSLRATIAVTSTAPVEIPELEDFTPRAERIRAMRQIEWGSERREMDIFLKKLGGDWQLLFTVSLLHRQGLPYYQVNLLQGLTTNADFGLGTDMAIGAGIAYRMFGPLADGDRVTLSGVVKQEAIHYKETELLPNIIVNPARVTTTVNIDALGRWDATDNQEYVAPINSLFGFIHRTMQHGQTGVIPGEIEDGNGGFLADKPDPIHYESQVLINPTLTNDTYWGDPNLEDTHMVLTRIENGFGDLGTLTLKPGALLTTPVRKLGLIILCDTLIVQSGAKISMSQRGANHSGTGISGGRTTATDIMLTSATIVNGLGGLGGESFTATSTRGGNSGLAGINSSGGGGTGSALPQHGGTATIGKGARGTIFAGGASSAGWYVSGSNVSGKDAGEDGGMGGDDDLWVGQTAWQPGIGNPTGGLAGFLAIHARTSVVLDTTGKLESKGTNGHFPDSAYATGGATGGGVIYVATSSFTQNGIIDVSGGVGGSPGWNPGYDSGDGGEGAYILEDLGMSP